MANLVNPKTKKNSIYGFTKERKGCTRNISGHDELRNSNADGSNSRTDSTYTGCS